MKILHVTKKYPDALGGDAIVVFNYEKEQLKNGDLVRILTSNCDEIIDAAHVYKFGLKDTPSALDNITFKRLLSLIILFFKAYIVLRKEKPDILHTHSIDMAFFVSFAARRYKIPIVHTFHIVTFNDPRQSGFRSKIELLLLRGTRPEQIFVLSPSLIADFQKAGFTNVKFIPNGVVADDWQPRPAITKSKLFTFIAVGRLEEQKGFTYLIEASKELKRQKLAFQVLIAGEGSLNETFESQIISAGLNGIVRLIGRKSPDELRDLYASSHAYVLTSLWEGMPLTMLESWAAGLPTVVTDISGLSYVTEDASLLVPPANSKALSEGMIKIFSDKNLRKP